MAANLSYANGKAEMFSGSGIVPWHKEGTILQCRANAAEAIEAAHLGWKVRKVPNFINNIHFDKTQPISESNVKGFSVPDSFTIIRDDKIGKDSCLGVVGKQYTPVQNDEAFSFFDSVIDRGEAIYESAGALGKGEKVWILAKLPDDIIVGGKDVVKEYLLLVNTHDGSRAFTARPTSVRVVCSNTLAMALSEANANISIRHTSDAVARIQEAARIIGLARKQSLETSEAFNRMAAFQVDTVKLRYFMEQVFPIKGLIDDSPKIKKTRELVTSLFEGGAIGSELAGRTMWQAVNCVSELVSHHKNYRVNKLDAIWFGSGNNLLQHSFNTALSMMQ